MKITYEKIQQIQEMSTEDLYTVWALAQTDSEFKNSLFVECVRYELENRLRNRPENFSVCA